VLSRIPIDRTIVVKEGVDELEDAPARAGPGLVTYVIAWVAAAVVVAVVLRAWRRARAR